MTKTAASELSGEFTLRGGKTSNRYFDKYLFESDPALLSDIAKGMVVLARLSLFA